MEYQLFTTLRDDTREAVNSLLRSYNSAHNPRFFNALEMAENLPLPLCVVVYNAKGKTVGGLIGETQFLWLRISIMAVDEHERRHGIGQRLLEIAEQEAVARRCQHAFLDTMDYQAPDFYQKHGYRVAGKLENWDSHGHTKYLFIKQLS